MKESNSWVEVHNDFALKEFHIGEDPTFLFCSGMKIKVGAKRKQGTRTPNLESTYLLTRGHLGTISQLSKELITPEKRRRNHSSMVTDRIFLLSLFHWTKRSFRLSLFSFLYIFLPVSLSLSLSLYIYIYVYMRNHCGDELGRYLLRQKWTINWTMMLSEILFLAPNTHASSIFPFVWKPCYVLKWCSRN